MNYLNVLFLGDSQTCGARTYGCYPLYLTQILTNDTPYIWRAIILAKNGYTARDLWFHMNSEIFSITDTYQACLLIGVNDVGNANDIYVFEEYYKQILIALTIHNYKSVFCGEIPPIHTDGHVFFQKETVNNRGSFDSSIRKVVAQFPNAHLVPIEGLERDCYEDPVHFNKKGNMQIARCFANVMKII